MRIINYSSYAPSISTSKDLSTDQQYLHKIVSAILSGDFPEYMANKSPGVMSHARWITRVNRILRLYVTTETELENLTTLAIFFVKVYASSWFHIKNKKACKDGTRHLFDIIMTSRYLPEDQIDTYQRLDFKELKIYRHNLYRYT